MSPATSQTEFQNRSQIFVSKVTFGCHLQFIFNMPLHELGPIPFGFRTLVPAVVFCCHLWCEKNSHCHFEWKVGGQRTSFQSLQSKEETFWVMRDWVSDVLITKPAMQVMNREGPEVFQSKCLTHQLPNRKTRKTSIFTLLEEMVTKHATKVVAKNNIVLRSESFIINRSREKITFCWSDLNLK